MKKMNRRDYLLQMGAGVVGVMGSAPLDVLAESLKPSARERTSAQTADLLWKPTDVFPTNAKVTVVFGGLFGFFYNSGTGNCEAGSHKGGGNHRHRLMVEVWERNSTSGACKRLFSTQNATLPNPTRNLKIEIVGRATSDVNFYQVGAYDRTKLNDHDFRWLPDLDSDDFYPDNPPKQSGKFHIKSIVRHGTIYTYQKTNSTFTRVDPPDRPVNQMDFYNVAEYMAAGIQPTANEDVSLQIDNDRPVVLKNIAGSNYEITIINHCYKSDTSQEQCKYQPNHPTNEMERNHFHFMRKVLQLPGGKKRYGLKVKDGKPSSPPSFCSKIMKQITDEAPCMGSGFGQTGGMP